MDEANKDVEIFRDFLSSADRYAMDRLKLVCEQALSRSLTVDNVCDTFTTTNRLYSGSNQNRVAAPAIVVRG